MSPKVPGDGNAAVAAHSIVAREAANGRGCAVDRPNAADSAVCSWLPSTSMVVSTRFGDYAAMELMLRANARGGTCVRLAPSGGLRVTVDELLKELEGMGYRLLRVSDAGPSGVLDIDTYEREAALLLVHRFGFAEVDATSEKPICVMSIDEEHVALLRKRLPDWVRPSVDKSAGPIYMLKAACGDAEFAAIGSGGRPLRRENYAAVTLDEIDHVTEDIAAPEPCGRIVLLTGPAGSGKTHVIRGILAAATKPRFVVIQAADLTSFLDASPLSALSDFARGVAFRRPIVIIIEDADGCLVPRAADNISQISALLNLSDGLIGAAFDIRILATTNAKTVEIDAAVTRPGRLCRRVEVPPLAPVHATEVLAGLLGMAPRSAFRRPTTLAEIYAAARDKEAD